MHKLRTRPLLATLTLCCIPLACMGQADRKSGTDTATRHRPTELAASIVHLDLKSASFSATLAEVSRQIGRGILADGLPIVAPADIQLEGPAPAVLDSVADRFDCVWEVSQSGILLFLNRYQDKDSIPQLDIREMRAAVNDIVRMMAALSPDLRISEARLLQELGRSILSDYPGGASFRGVDLTAYQQELLAKALKSTVLNSAYVHWLALKAALKWRKPEELAIHILGLDDPEKRWLNVGVEGPEPVNAFFGIHPIAIPLSRVQSLFEALKKGDPIRANQTVPQLTEAPAIRLASPAIAPTTGAQGLPQSVSLSLSNVPISELVAELAHETGTRIEVEEPLLSRRISMVVDHASLRDTLAAICELNDWRLDAGPPLRIRRFHIALPRNVGELADSLSKALPRDIRRYIGLEGKPEDRNPGAPHDNERKPLRPELAKVDLNWRIGAQIGSYLERKGIPLLSTIMPKQALDGTTGKWNRPLSILSAQQQDLLVKLVILKQVSESLTGTDGPLFTGRLDPYYRDPSLAFVTVTPAKIQVSGPAFGIRGGTSFTIVSIRQQQR